MPRNIPYLGRFSFEFAFLGLRVSAESSALSSHSHISRASSFIGARGRALASSAARNFFRTASSPFASFLSAFTILADKGQFGSDASLHHINLAYFFLRNLVAIIYLYLIFFKGTRISREVTKPITGISYCQNCWLGFFKVNYLTNFDRLEFKTINCPQLSKEASSFVKN